jgi:NAD(P)-dependent dehydrogenase (short-subunit alcohol dehydrogenase family)
MKKRTIVMTGGTSGLGKEAALNLLADGHTLFVIARDNRKAESLLKESQNLKGSLKTIAGDLNDLNSVEHASNMILGHCSSIDQLILNAGIMNFKFLKSNDGIEQTLQVNLISQILIIEKLLPLLVQSKEAKIIFTSSGLHQGEINFDNLEFTKNFTGFKVYRQSKLGVILICRLLSERFKNLDIGIYSQHPGLIRTDLGRFVKESKKVQLNYSTPRIGAINELTSLNQESWWKEH